MGNVNSYRTGGRLGHKEWGVGPYEKPMNLLDVTEDEQLNPHNNPRKLCQGTPQVNRDMRT